MRMRTIGLSLALFVVSAGAMTKQAHAAHHHPEHGPKAKSGKIEVPSCKRQPAARHGARQRAAPRASQAGERVAAAAPPDRYIGPVQVVGRREIGAAAWYGGWHVGQRTASGERLDGVRLTAAHRSLPLNSLARVTNLNNGRTVVVTVNDRGPVSRRLLIDVSPRAAQELGMLGAGVVPVAIEPVARVQTAAQRP
jgi:rare lipoprotein A